MEYSIPSPANMIMEQVAPVLLQFCAREKIILGGGTALAARWHHRSSTDIDLFLALEDFQKIHEELAAMFASSGGFLLWEDGQGWCRGRLAEGEFAIATTLPVLKTAPDVNATEETANWGFALEAVDEILAKKLRLRIYGNGEFLARDCYDLVTAAEKDSDSLLRALGVLNTHQRGEIANELRSIRSIARLGGRALEAPHHPEWLTDLPIRAAEIVEKGPTVRPMPEKQPPTPPSSSGIQP